MSKKTKSGSVWTKRLLVAFVMVSVVAAVGFGVYNYQLKNQQQQLLDAIDKQKQALATLKEREQVGERMRAADILQKAQNYRVEWSEIVKALKSEVEQPSGITFNSVSVTNGNQVGVQGEAPSLLGVAAWLKLVNSSDSFSHGFVGTISPASEDKGTYLFSATFEYTPVEPETETDIELEPTVS